MSLFLLPCAELRELTDRLISWLTLCMPANNHPLSVSHRRKLKQFKVWYGIVQAAGLLVGVVGVVLAARGFRFSDFDSAARIWRVMLLINSYLCLYFAWYPGACAGRISLCCISLSLSLSRSLALGACMHVRLFYWVAPKLPF